MCVRGGGLCSCCVMLRVLYSPPNAHVFEVVGCVPVVLCCVSCILLSMRMCVRGGGLCSCCVMLRVLYSPPNAHVCSRWWVVFLLCYVACLV
jgi:hypothetical protein